MPNQIPKLRETGFVRLRNGIWEHIKEGKITANDFAVYCTLHAFADWNTGICTTTASSIASAWGSFNATKNTLAVIRISMQRLRNNGYILYQKGSGKRGPYKVALDKYEPSIGAAVGWQLNAKKTMNIDNPMYDYVSPTRYDEAYGDYYTHIAIEAATSQEDYMVVNNTVEVVVSLSLQAIQEMYIDIFKPYQEIASTSRT